MPRPLQGRVVAVTRPRSQADPLSRALARAGARVVFAPLIRVAPPRSTRALDDALKTLASYDAAVFTSGTSVDRFFERTRALGLPAAPRAVYAVGPHTAERLSARGLRARAFRGARTGAELARALPAVAGLRILVPRAENGDPSLARILRARGATVRVAAAYRTLPDRSGLRGLSGRADAVVFASPSAVDALFRLKGTAAARSLLSGAVAAAIGPTTAAALKRRGAKDVVVAARPAPEEIVRALAARWAA